MKLRSILKISLLTFLVISVICLCVFFFYLNNTGLVATPTREYYEILKKKIVEKGYKDRFMVISTKRFKWHNDLQVLLSGAAEKSRHLSGQAIDFIVFDVNGDDISDDRDVDVVYNILDKEIIQDKGGIGTYKNEHLFYYRQMIHIDCRGSKARWAR